MTKKPSYDPCTHCSQPDATCKICEIAKFREAGLDKLHPSDLTLAVELVNAYNKSGCLVLPRVPDSTYRDVKNLLRDWTINAEIGNLDVGLFGLNPSESKLLHAMIDGLEDLYPPEE